MQFDISIEILVMTGHEKMAIVFMFMKFNLLYVFNFLHINQMLAFKALLPFHAVFGKSRSHNSSM